MSIILMGKLSNFAHCGATIPLLMPRLHLFLAVFLILASASTSCKHPESFNPLVVHVLRDPSTRFAGKLRQADLQFALTKPHLDSGRGMMVATNEGSSFAMLLQ